MPDIWTTATLGEAFPGPTATMGALKDQADSLFEKFNALKNQISNRAGALSGMADECDDFMTALAKSGFYKLTLTPGAGGWLTRAQNAAGAPPNSGYSAGVLIVISAPDLSGITEQFGALDKMFSTPVNVTR